MRKQQGVGIPETNQESWEVRRLRNRVQDRVTGKGHRQVSVLLSALTPPN